MYRRIPNFVLIVSFTSLSIIGFSVIKSTQAKSDTGKNRRPNIVVLTADDMGYTDLGAFGGEIPTPNIDSLAKGGTMLTNFHVLPSCSPSRSQLLTGVDHHQNGLGNMEEILTPNQKGKPGYEGHLNDKVVTLPTLLKDAGYHTFMAGKWHLGKDPGTLPSDKGFEQSFALLQGGGGHYNDMPFDPYSGATYVENGKTVKLPTNFYSTVSYTNKLIEYIDKNHGDGKPFLAYAAYTAPHEPLQAPQAEIDKHINKYKQGWDNIRQQRFNRMKQLGLIPDYLELPPRFPRVPAWDTLKPEQKQYEAKTMAIYAAMTTIVDNNIGRLIEHLKNIGEYNNTIFVFLSDNGAAGDNYAEDDPQAYEAWFKKMGINNSYENIGNANSFIGYGQPWAQVGSTPFQWFKGKMSEGGIRAPMIVFYPGAAKSKSKIDAFTNSLDFTPTLLDYAGVKHPGTNYKGRTIFPIQGRSLRPILEGKVERIYSPNDPIGMELYGTGNSALFLGDWKIVLMKQPWGDGTWKLYNLSLDPTELKDLSKMYPLQLKKMIALYEKYEKEKGVVPAKPADKGS
ncbi:MAG TPA: arylsulfatase [Kamptonema sp.]|nr:arylsulfatase [Kamptonema sp.]